MSFDISHLDNHTPGENFYFFDTNVWLLVLGIRPILDEKEEKYVNFFQNVKDNNGIIALSAMMISEVVNRYLRDIKMREYANINKDDWKSPRYYKEKYRASKQFINDLSLIYSEIDTYLPFCTLISDSFGYDGFKKEDILQTVNVNLDFNDYYFYKLSLYHHAILVSDDKDFFVPDVRVLTLNRDLISRAKDKVQIKVKWGQKG